MRRLLSLFALTILLSSTALADSVSREDALQAGENWLAARADRGEIRIMDCTPVLDSTRGALLGYHLPLSPAGHVLVSSRLELPPVKSFSFETDFDPADEGGYSALLMESLAATEAFLSENEGNLGAKVEMVFERHRATWRDLLAGTLAGSRDPAVGPFIQSSWHQSPPYNNDCPPGDGGSTCVVGCVATSAAMIMKYWEYPAYGEGSHSYLWGGDDSCGPNVGGGMLSADFYDDYDWENILHSYGGGATPAQLAAVAELNYEVAVAFEMDFGVCGSGTWVYIGENIYPNFFRYSDESIDFVNRNTTDADGWWAMIKGELDAFPPRPMHYRITSHSIICDGYQEDAGARYYHMNYGWGGGSNAWYALDEVYCPWDGCNYLSEGMVLGIEPLGYFMVSEPADGAVWTHGDDLGAVSWSGATGVDVVLDLYKGTQFLTRLADWTANDGHEILTGTVDAAWGTGNNYRIKVVGDDNRFAWSGTFGIYGAGTWSDVTAAPLDDAGSGQSAAWGDCDGDGWCDLYLSNDSSANHLFGNQAGIGFGEMGGAPLDVSGHSRGAAWADIDNDGDLDLYVAFTSGEANMLFRNDGGGFTDITAGPLGDTSFSGDAAWGDYDGDGFVDLYIANAYAADKLLRGNGDGSFVDVTASPLGDGGYGRSVSWGDYDGDGDLDIYLVRNGSNKLYRNNGDGSFTDRSAASGLSDSGNGFGAAWADFDGDADLDLYVTNDGANKLFRNQGDGSFVDITAPPLDDAGIGRGAAWGDFDGDGAIDLYLSNNGANKLFQNQGGGLFADSTHPLLGDEGSGGGVAWADYDQDGDLDLYVVNGDGANRLLRNDTVAGHWLELDLVGGSSNRLGIGAFVTAIVGGERQCRQLGGDAGYLSGNAPTLHMGFGSATVVDTLRVLWPSGVVNEYFDVALDQRMTLDEEATPAGEAPALGYALLANYPNPFNPITEIRFSLPEATTVSLEVYDLSGRRVRTLLAGESRDAGLQGITWDGRDDAGVAMPSGVYLSRIQAAEFNAARKLVLLK